MIFSKTSVSGIVEILAADEFTAIPITVDETSAVKAGTPMTSAGKFQSTLPAKGATNIPYNSALYT